MSASTSKRLILYRFDRQPVEALVHADAFLLVDGIEVMSRDGVLQLIDYNSVKAMCFGAEGAPPDLFVPPTAFERRPKNQGIWASFRLRDEDVLEGVLPRNLLEWPPQGYFLTPPRTNAYRQRVFLPRQAVRETSVLGLIGKGTAFETKGAKRLDLDSARQLTMFD